MELDIRTILVFFFLTSTFIVVLLLAYAIITRSNVWNLKFFIAARSLFTIGLALIAARGYISDLFSLTLANPIAIFALGLEAYSFTVIDGKFKRRLLILMMLASSVFSVLFVLISSQPDNIRIIFGSIPGLTFTLFAAVHLLIFKRQYKLSKLVAAFYVLLGVAYVVRLVNATVDENIEFLMSSNWVEPMFFITNNLVLVVGSIGYVLIMKEGQEYEILEKNRNLNELNATKDKFFSIIAHDLRGPIGALNNMGKVLLDQHGELTNEDREDLISAVNESSGLALGLLNNLLYWAQSESGKLQVNITQFRPTDLLTRASLIFREAAHLKNITIEVPERSNETATADMEMIDTVIRNLFSNAVKFTPEHGRIVAGYRVISDELFEIFVKDSGVGMSPEVQSQLFKLDSNFTSRGTNQERGSGLGLKLCKEFVEKNGGIIGVSSKPGVGTTFKFTLRRICPEDASQFDQHVTIIEQEKVEP